MREEAQTLVLYSRSNEFARLEEFIENISDQFNIGHTYFSNIIVALTELVKNAMLHGNQNDSQKKVFVEFKQEEGNLKFSVTDQGSGFDFPIPQPSEMLTDLNIKNGLSIVYALSDGLEFEENGRKITVIFNIAAANELLSKSRISALKQSGQTKEDKKKIHD